MGIRISSGTGTGTGMGISTGTGMGISTGTGTGTSYGCDEHIDGEEDGSNGMLKMHMNKELRMIVCYFDEFWIVMDEGVVSQHDDHGNDP